MAELELATMTDTLPAPVTGDTAASTAIARTKDAGRVRIGGGTMRFKAAPASSRDAGRVKLGGGTIQF